MSARNMADVMPLWPDPYDCGEDRFDSAGGLFGPCPDCALRWIAMGERMADEMAEAEARQARQQFRVL